jgi:hypothetical protein
MGKATRLLRIARRGRVNDLTAAKNKIPRAAQ